MDFIMFIIFGLVVGAIAKFVMPGRDPSGWIITAVIGMVGSLIGGMLGRALGWYSEGTSTAGFAMSILGAVVLLALYRAVSGSRLTA